MSEPSGCDCRTERLLLAESGPSSLLLFSPIAHPNISVFRTSLSTFVAFQWENVTGSCCVETDAYVGSTYRLRTTTAWMQDDCREAGARATQGAVAEVGQRREHDYREVGARVTPGAVTVLPGWSRVRVPPGAPMFQFSGTESLPDYASPLGRLPLVTLKPAGPP